MNNLNMLRHERGMTFKEFSEYLGLSFRTTVRYCYGDSVPAPLYAAALEQKTGETVEYLFAESETPPTSEADGDHYQGENPNAIRKGTESVV